MSVVENQTQLQEDCKIQLPEVLANIDNGMVLVENTKAETSGNLKRYKKNKENLQWVEGIKLKLQNLKTDYLILNSLTDEGIREKSNYDRMVVWLREARELRIKLDDSRKADSREVKKITDALNVFYSLPIEYIEEMEEKIKPIRKKITEADEAEKKRKKEEEMARTNKRISELIAIGAKLVEGFYVLENPNDPDDCIEIQGVDINNTSDGNWAIITEKANQIKDKILADELKERERKEKEKQELKDKQEKLDRERKEMEVERYNNRKEVLLSLGLNELEDKSFVFDNKVLISRNEIVSCDSESWTNKVLKIKSSIQDLNTEKIYKDNFSRLIQAGFKTNKLNRDLLFEIGFGEDSRSINVVDKDLTDVEFIDIAINDSIRHTAEIKEKEDKFNAVINERSVLLNKLGFRHDYNSGNFTLNLDAIGENIVVTKKELFGYTETDIISNTQLWEQKLKNNESESARLLKEEEDRIAKEKEEKRKKDEAENLAKQNDKQKLESLFHELTPIFGKYSFEQEKTNNKFKSEIEKFQITLSQLIS